jgi:D-aminopeptidase
MAQTVSQAQDARRPRAREAGVIVGVLPAGPLNAITDVAGVSIGHSTIIRGDNVRTGVTAVLPHGGNLFREKVPGAVFIGNAFGKLAGSTQVNELRRDRNANHAASTLNVPRVADATIDYMLALSGNEAVQSINPLVGETNDGYLNEHSRTSRRSRDEVVAAIKNARRIGGRGQRRCGHGFGSLWVQRRNRNVVAQNAGLVGWLHRRRAGADEFRQNFGD